MRNEEQKDIRIQRIQAKKRYVSPELVEYGAVSKLTKGGAVSDVSDSGSNMMRPP